MHPKKAEALAGLAEGSREFDEAINRLRDIALHPNRNGWGTSLKAAATLPALGLGALMVDAGEVMVRRISDSEFGRDFPGDEAQTAPSE